MLWAPNVAFGPYVDSVRGGYSRYWPGADTVDISGESFQAYFFFSRAHSQTDAVSVMTGLSFYHFGGLSGVFSPRDIWGV